MGVAFRQNSRPALAKPLPPSLSWPLTDQFHGPAAKPVLGLRRRPARQRNFMTIEAAHPRPMRRNLAAVEADLALRRAPAVAHPASAAAVRRARRATVRQAIEREHRHVGATDPGRRD